MSLKNLLPSGASYELRQQRTTTSAVSFSGNEFERISSSDSLSETLRLLHQGKLSIANSSKPGDREELLKQALGTVAYGSPHDVDFAGEATVAQLNLVDEATLNTDQMVEMAGDFVADLRSVDPRLYVSATIQATKEQVALETSKGFSHSYAKTAWTCFAGIELVQEEDRLGIFAFQMELGPHFNLKKLKEEQAQMLEYAKTVVDFAPGAYPVIFAPQEVFSIVNPIVASMNGMSVARKLSPWADKLGQELLDPRFTLVDDGTLDKTMTSLPFDMEGTPTRRNVLVQSGRADTLLLDRKTAQLLGKESTGNAGARGNPQPHHLQLATGNKSLEELIAAVDYGMIIYSTMGAWSGNPFAGIVSGTIALGLKIENGKIVGRAKDCMFTVNAFEHLRKHFVDCSDITKPAMIHRFPYVLLDEVVISTK